MSDYTELMGELIELGVNANPAWPFTACVVDASGQILITTCNANHISPLYTAEGLALHLLASEFDCQLRHPLTMITTAEPDDLSLMALYWARHRGINITELVYGATRKDIRAIWEDDPSQGLDKGLQKFPFTFTESLTLSGCVLQSECREAFEEGQALFRNDDDPVRSMDIDQYWMAGDWLVDDWMDDDE